MTEYIKVCGTCKHHWPPEDGIYCANEKKPILWELAQRKQNV